jgi:RNA polymerase sigma factor (sigma-70 family)
MPATALSDAELLHQARNGDEAAFTELYVRHQPAALRLASTYRRLGDPEDLVNQAFEEVLAAVRRGGGPTDAFRAYLFVTLRRLAAEQAERPGGQPLDNVPKPVVAESAEPEMARADRDIMNDAFESLPDQWQTVSWHSAVDGRAPRGLASVLSVSPNAAAALAYRAREKLRQAYLQSHLLASPHPECEPHRSRLGAYARGGLSRRDQAATKRHVGRCDSCQALTVELTDVNRMLVRSLLPFFLVGSTQVAALAAGAAGGVAAGTVGKGAEAGATSGPASGGKGAWRHMRDLAPSAGSAGVAALLVAGLTVASMAVSRGDGPTDVAADAAGLGSSGFDGGRAPAFRPDVGDDEPPADDVFTAGPFHGPAGFDSDLPPDDGLPSRFNFRPRFDEGAPRRAWSGSPPGQLPRRSANAPSGRPPTPAPSAPASPSPPPPSLAPPSPPPTRPDPAPPPPPPPVVVPLTFVSAPEWAPSGVGRGDLTVRIGEANAQAASAAAEATATVSRQLQIQLTPGAQAAEDGVDSRCTLVAAGADQRIDCTIQPPPRGGTIEVHAGLNAAVADQSATVTLRRGSVVEASSVVPLDRYEEGLGLVASAWAPSDLAGHELPIGRLTIGAEQRGSRPLPGVSLEVTLAGDAGFVPAVPGIDLLPDGCSTPGWPPPGGSGEIPLPPHPSAPPALLGGVPTTVVCDLGELTSGDAARLRDLVALVRPWYRDDDGTDEAPSATVTLRLQDPAADPDVSPEVHDLATETIGIDLPEG